MKKHILIVVIIIVIPLLIIFGQNSTNNKLQNQNKSNPELILDKDYFLLGTLSDYLGRQKSYKNESFIDEYYEGESSLMSYIIQIYSSENPEFVIEKSQNPYSSAIDILNSKKIAAKMNSFYNFTNDGGFRMDPSISKHGWKEFRKSLDDFHKSTEPKDTIYVGTLKANIFKTKAQKISFIVGIYSRYGLPYTPKSCIRMYNSQSKYDCCLAILKQLKCENIEKEITTNMIPTNQTIYFKPSPELKKYIDKYQTLILRSPK